MKAGELLARLPATINAPLALAAGLGEGMGLRLWLVGGVVRDLLLGVPLGPDVDLAVEGEVGALGSALAEATGGRVVAAHPPFGTATVAVPGEGGELMVDLARTRVERYPRPAALPEVTPAPIEADLIRRDFSVNAMALGLGVAGGRLVPGRLLDPFDGRADLAARRLRLLHGASLRDDPTRLLRGVRQAARLGMEPEATTQAQIAAALAAGYLSLVTPERLLNELCLTLAEPRPDEVMRVATHWGVVGQLVPGLAWSPALAERANRFATDGQAYGPRNLVWAGLLLYDLPQAGLAALAERYHLPSEATALLRQLPALRGMAPQLREATPNSLIDRLLRPFATAAIAVLHYAEPATAAPTARYLDQLRQARPPLDGNDLRRLGVAPGPGLGILLEELRALALDGAVTTRAAAEEWVRTRIARSP